jgi:hypothetical protein
MENGLLAANTLDQFDVPTILIVGAIATLFHYGFQQLSVRFKWVRPRLAKTIGSILIPKAFYSSVLEVGIQLFQGIFAAGVYAFIYHFAKLETIAAFATLGMMIGVVHGVFISFFINMGFSPINPKDLTLLRVSTLNIALQSLLGGVVGLGFGFQALTGDFLKFAGVATALGVILLVSLRATSSAKSDLSRQLTLRSIVHKAQ